MEGEGQLFVVIYCFHLNTYTDDNLKYRLPRQVTVIDKKSGLNMTTFTPLEQEVIPRVLLSTLN